MLRRLIASGAVALACVTTACGATGARAVSRVTDGEAGFTIALPPGWRMVVDAANGPGSAMLSTYRVARLGDVGETPPPGESWILLHSDGPLWALPPWRDRIRPLPARLPPARGMEGFGSARMLQFRLARHAFTVYVKGAAPEQEVLAMLRSIRLTRFGRSLALDISSRLAGDVRIWRVGNPRSSRRVLVVGCPGTKPCPGLAVTNRLVNGVTPVAADLWVIQLLRGRRDVLASLQRRLRPEATISLGAVQDADAWTRRIVAISRR